MQTKSLLFFKGWVRGDIYGALCFYDFMTRKWNSCRVLPNVVSWTLQQHIYNKLSTCTFISVDVEIITPRSTTEVPPKGTRLSIFTDMTILRVNWISMYNVNAMFSLNKEGSLVSFSCFKNTHFIARCNICWN
jgi:hypothetical protein